MELVSKYTRLPTPDPYVICVYTYINETLNYTIATKNFFIFISGNHSNKREAFYSLH